MAARAGSGFSTATELADGIVRGSDHSFRTAHYLVARLARDVAPDEIDTALLDAVATDVIGEPLGLDPETISAALDPRRNVDVRDSLGGRPGEVETALADARETLTTDRDSLATRDRALTSAREQLADTVQMIKTVE